MKPSGLSFGYFLAVDLRQTNRLDWEFNSSQSINASSFNISLAFQVYDFLMTITVMIRLFENQVTLPDFPHNISQ